MAGCRPNSKWRYKLVVNTPGNARKSLEEGCVNFIFVRDSSLDPGDGFFYF